MKVRLISHTPNPEKILAIAGSVCYSDESADKLLDNMMSSDVDKYCKMLVNLPHKSLLEHISFTFLIDGVSRSYSHQQVRHRMASYSQRSQRYVNEDNCNMIYPDEILNSQNLNDIFKDSNLYALESYNNLKDILIIKFIEQGFKEKDSIKKAQEIAREVLPNATETIILVTMNGNSLRNFFSERMCMRAQAHIREVAQSMYVECVLISPTIFSNMGPKCKELLYCPENHLQDPLCKNTMVTKNTVRDLINKFLDKK
jgi:thymidylate synthase (FAD)